MSFVHNVHTQTSPQLKLYIFMFLCGRPCRHKLKKQEETRLQQDQNKSRGEKKKKSRYEILMKQEGGGEVRRARKLKPTSSCFVSLKRDEQEEEK